LRTLETQIRSAEGKKPTKFASWPFPVGNLKPTCRPSNSAPPASIAPK